MRVINNTYAVFFDTNTIKGKYWIDHAVRKHATSITKDTMITVELCLPEVVKKEWTRYYSRYVQEQHNILMRARSRIEDMNYTASAEDDFKPEEVTEKAEQFLTELGFSFIDTPHSDIDYPELIELAIKHEPPFEPNDGTDKGLKDAIIAHTIKVYSDNNPDKKIVFIGRDGLMTGYLQSIMSNQKIFTAYESIEKFAEELKLKNNNLSKELAQGASDAFFKQDVKSTFYFSLNVRDLVVGKYRSKIVDADAAKKHLKTVRISDDSISLTDVSGGLWSIASNKVLVSNPSFDRKEGNRLFWTTNLDFVQNYNVKANGLDSITTYGSYVVKHTVTYGIYWSAVLSKEGVLINPSIEKAKELSEEQAITAPNTPTTLSSLNHLLNPNPTAVSALQKLSTELASPQLNALNSLLNANKNIPDMSWITSAPKLSISAIPDVSKLKLPSTPTLTTINLSSPTQINIKPTKE